MYSVVNKLNTSRWLFYFSVYKDSHILDHFPSHHSVPGSSNNGHPRTSKGPGACQVWERQADGQPHHWNILFIQQYLCGRMRARRVLTLSNDVHRRLQDQLRLEGLRSLARIFYPLLARKSSGFFSLEYYVFLPGKWPFWKKLYWGCSPRLVRIWRCSAENQKAAIAKV